MSWHGRCAGRVSWRRIAAACLLGWVVPSAASAQTAPTEPAATATLETPSEAPAPGHYSLFDTVTLSIFNKHAPKREWTPLYASTFFTEGWLEPHIGPPNGSGGSVRQGWVGVPEAFFNRQIVGFYTHRRGANGAPNDQSAAFILESPMNRRYNLGVFAVFLSDTGGNGAQHNTTFGDLLIFNRFLLHETQDLSVSANLNVRVPTGSTSTDNGRTTLIPYLAFYKDFGWKGVSARGAIGFDFPVDSRPPDSRESTFFLSYAMGQTLTKHDTPLFGDFTYYVSLNVLQDLGGGNPNANVTLTPGFRTHLGREWFLLAGITYSVTGPRTLEERVTFLLVKGF